MSAEPPTAAWVQGKRWEDLIEAATSATEADDDRDLTPVCFFDTILFSYALSYMDLKKFMFQKELHPGIGRPL
jgi:hypothetical protein